MDLVILYLLTVAVSFVVYVLIERRNNDVTLGTLISMFTIALIPIINVIVLLSLLEDMMSESEFKFKDVVVINKRK